MDEKKVREAIGALKIINLKRVHPFYDWEEMREVRDVAIEALEKQLPEKVKMRTEYRDLNDELICYEGFCPNCGKEVNSYRNKSCSHCTQMLEWTEEVRS